MQQKNIFLGLLAATIAISFFLGKLFWEAVFWETVQNTFAIIFISLVIWRWDNTLLRYVSALVGSFGGAFVIYLTEPMISSSQFEVTLTDAVYFGAATFVMLILFGFIINKFKPRPMKAGIIGAFMGGALGLFDVITKPDYSSSVLVSNIFALANAGFVVPYLLVQVKKEASIYTVISIGSLATWLMSFAISIINYL